MPAPDLLTVGEAFADLVFVGLARLPRPGEEIKTSRFLETIGGGAVITAVAAARLGTRTRIVSGLSAAAAARLRYEGVDVANLRRPAEPHAVTAALSTRTERTFVTFNGINDVLEPRLAAAVPREPARHVHFAFYPQDCRRWVRIVERCRERGSTTSWDFGWNQGLLRDRQFPALLRALDYVLLNEDEALLYSRRTTLRAAVTFWRAHPRAVIVKLGRRGSRWLSRDLDVAEPAPAVEAVDTTGAGDAFNGGFLYGVLRGLPPRACLAAGNVAGALSTRAAGGLDALPRFNDLPPGLRKRAARRARRSRR